MFQYASDVAILLSDFMPIQPMPPLLIHADATPTVVRRDSKTFEIVFDAPDANVSVIQLSEHQLRTLSLLALNQLPDLVPTIAVPDENEAYRLPARKLALLDNRSMQRLIRELEVDTLETFLWFMNDDGLANKVVNNMSAVAAQMLVDDLRMRYAEHHPDQVPLAYVNSARPAVGQVLDIYSRLVRDGLAVGL